MNSGPLFNICTTEFHTMNSLNQKCMCNISTTIKTVVSQNMQAAIINQLCNFSCKKYNSVRVIVTNRTELSAFPVYVFCMEMQFALFNLGWMQMPPLANILLGNDPGSLHPPQYSNIVKLPVCLIFLVNRFIFSFVHNYILYFHIYFCK